MAQLFRNFRPNFFRNFSPNFFFGNYLFKNFFWIFKHKFCILPTIFQKKKSDFSTQIFPIFAQFCRKMGNKHPGAGGATRTLSTATAPSAASIHHKLSRRRSDFQHGAKRSAEHWGNGSTGGGAIFGQIWTFWPICAKNAIELGHLNTIHCFLIFQKMEQKRHYFSHPNWPNYTKNDGQKIVPKITKPSKFGQFWILKKRIWLMRYLIIFCTQAESNWAC